MAHQHSVYDTDKHFKIDPITREIINQTPAKIQLMQGDHNSERFTFEIAKVDGHDMSKCDKIEVHYINVAADKTEQSEDVYPVGDMQISPSSNDVIIFSWLISGNATKYAGTLSFIVRFTCLTGETIDYVWNTGIFKGISVGEGMNNSEAAIAEYTDVLEAWRQSLFEAGGDSVANVNVARDAALQQLDRERSNILTDFESKREEVLASIPEDYNALSANVEANAADIAELQKTAEKHSSLIARDDKRITTLEAAVYGDLAQEVVDNTAAHIKDVPAAALHTVRLDKIGGIIRKCTNLLKIPYAGGNTKTAHGITFTAKPDGGITISGTNTDTTYVEYPLITTNSLILTSENVTVTLSGADSSDIYCTVGGGGFAFNEVRSGTTVVLANNGTTNVFSYGLLRVKAGATVTNVTVYPMFNAGSTVLPYEPYFEGLRSAPVTEIKSESANLIPYPYASTTTSQFGVKFTDNGDGSVTVDGTATQYVSFLLSKTPINLIPGEKYYLSAVPSGVSIILAYKNAADEMKYFSQGSLTWDSSFSFYSLYLQVSTGTTAKNAVVSPMLVKGSTAVSYKPYKEPVSFTIPEAVRALDGYGEGVNATYNNHICYENDGRITWKRRVVKKVFDGTEDFHIASSTLEGTASNYFSHNLSSLGSVIDDAAVCNKFDNNTPTSSNTAIGFRVYNSPGYNSAMIIVRPDDVEHLTAAQFKALLAEWYAAGDPLVIYYALATPEVTDISGIMPVDNYIEVDGDGSLIFVNEYGYDVPSEVVFVTKGASE